jgi:hypothetical protein
MSNFIIIGNKGYKNIGLNNIIDNFLHNLRCNINCPNNNNGTKSDIHYFNCHVYDNIVKKKFDLKKLIDCYGWFTKTDDLTKFYNYCFNNYSKLKFVPQINKNYDNFLKNLGCNIDINSTGKIFSCGYHAIFESIIKGILPFIFGFGLTINDRMSYYYKDIASNKNSATRSPCHNEQAEIEILKWLHRKNYVDATMCCLEDNVLPIFSCSQILIKPFIINLFLKEYGICIIKDFYPGDVLEQIISEYHRIFQDQKQKITYCKGDEDEIPDPRIFNVEKYSTIIQNNFSNNSLLNNIVRNYTNSNFNKKTLINKVIYKENQKMNSGGGWHRDNHDKQFKTIMYLSDVTENNGCFQFITNSSKKHIGYPEPRTANYNTRYTDNTIKDILEKYKNCKIHDIVGKKGTIILVDTTYIHRGKVIEEGERYAMTEYYF